MKLSPQLVRCNWHRDLRRWLVLCRVCLSLTSVPVAIDVTAYVSVTTLIESINHHLGEHAAGRRVPPFRFYYPAGE